MIFELLNFAIIVADTTMQLNLLYVFINLFLTMNCVFVQFFLDIETFYRNVI